MSQLKTVDIVGVEIARVGSWLGTDPRGRAARMSLTREDFDAAAASWEEVESQGKGTGDAPLKLGHQMEQKLFHGLAAQIGDGMMSFGWASRLRRKGDVLLADFIGVPAKLAPFLEVGAWRRRSIEFGRQYPAGGRLHPFYITAVSLLGAVPPAVEGLADLYAGAARADELSLICCATPGEGSSLAKDTETGEGTEASFEDLVARFRAMLVEAEVFVAGRSGVRTMRALAATFERQLRAASRTTGGALKMDYRDIFAVLSGTDTDEPTDKQLVAGLAKNPTALGAVALLAQNSDAALAVLAEILGMPGATADEIVNAVREMAGGEPVEETTSIGDGQVEEGEMSKATEARFAKLEARIKAAESETATALADAAKSTVQLAKNAAITRADADIRSHSLPSAIRDTLITLASRGDDDLYESVVKGSARVPTHEKGTSTLSKLAEIELTPAEIEIAREHGNDLESVRRTKAAAAGITVSDD